MRICGIVAEYNPFHDGHLHLVKKARQSPDDLIIVALSGSFVQRGKIALCDKWTRAAWALEAGADLVVELPTVFVLQSGSHFAAGAVRLLADMGCNALCFGSEIADISLFDDVMHQLSVSEADRKERLAYHIKSGKSHPRAFYESYIEQFGKNPASEILRNPNAFLSLSYMQAAQRYAPNMVLQMIRRVGAGYHDATLDQYTPSATAIRKAIYSQDQDAPVSNWDAFVPSYVASTLKKGSLVQYESMDNLYLLALRMASAHELATICGVTEGLENRLISASRHADMASVISSIKTKRYTHTRIQRTLSSILLAITKDLAEQANHMEQSYAHILGFRASATPILKKLRQKGYPLWMKKNDLDVFSDLHKQLAVLDIRATDLQALAFSSPSARRAKKDFTHPLRCWPNP